MSPPGRLRAGARRMVESARASGSPAPQDAAVPLFDQPFYRSITDARLDHLAGMNLDLSGRSVIDVGCGIGRLSDFFVERGCEVLCVDGREENIRHLRSLYPDRRAAVVDAETDALLECGKFEVVFCYGLLYHLADPFGFLHRAAGICEELMILETCVTDAEAPVVFLVRDPNDPTMALHTVASRPSPSYIALALRRAGLPHVYSPTRLPAHEDFRYARRNDLSYFRDGRPLRDVFVASRTPLHNDALRGLEPLLPPPAA